CRPLAEGTTVTGKLCEVTLAAAGTTCAFDEADDGLCKNGLCAPATCGNGEVDDGEDCDDSQDGDNGDGCRDDCAFTCAGDDDCDDGNGCNGTETCTAAHVCTPPKAESCMDDENCTMNLCVDGSCVYEIVDNDSDGFPDIECKDEDRYGEWDCDGMRGDVYPGAPEQCDEVSHDCDSKVDEDTDDLSCFQDLDGDSFGDPDERKIADCSCPAGYVVNKLDCHDVGNQAKSVNPDYPTGEYSAIPYCKKGSGTAGCTELSFDFDCDGKETPVSTKLAGNCTSASPGSCEQFSGWLANVPECGEEGRRVLCNEPSGADTIKSCQPQFLEQKQRCR
ncbi:MAG: hypothetical protein KC416_03940, partial [Myxococcales bacterium]|nr:hypothetical protein [Myxococcales bacterium]